MGCSDSKSAGTQNGSSQPANTDKNKPGDAEVYVTVEEAIGYIRDEYGVEEEHARRIIDKINKNHDGKISDKELRRLWATVKERRETMMKTFAELDTDNNGWVTEDQAVKVITERFKDLPEKGVRAMVKRFDPANDGKITYKDFIFFYCNVVARKDYLQSQFQSLDKDGSGALSPDEVWRFIQDECSVSESTARSLVEDYDCNKDGKINKAEFSGLMDKFSQLVK